MSRLFDHEKLEVYRASLSLIAWLEPIPERLANSDYRLHDGRAE